MVEWFVDVSFVSFDTLNDSSERKTDCVSEASFRMLNMSAAWVRRNEDTKDIE